MLDESLSILSGAWSGEPVSHKGEHYTVDDFEFHPQPYRNNAIPVWVGGLAGRSRPLQRAARYDGYVPVNLTRPDQLAEAVAHIRDARGGLNLDAYDIVAGLPPETDPQPFAQAGATCLRRLGQRGG